uniref:BED-type domain-containing protein n=1 Tax=Populus trichocarpa TaxID=3694 RepID=A0A3N7FRP9_POPTR|eukprot:XP_002317527.3 probable disease resistance protein At4g27220 [Populus trichocarpa]
MVRPNDPFWDYVEKMTGGLLRCMFCEYIFAVATSISRIKSHFAGVKRRGVNICTKVPKEIQEASYLAIHGSRKKLKTMPSEVANKFSTSSLEEKNEVEILARDIEEVLMEAESSDEVESKSPAELIQFVETGSSVEGNVADVHETGGTALPRMDLVGQSIEKDWQEIFDLSKENDDLNCSREDMAGDLIQEGLHETRGDALLTTELVGQAFQRNTDEIWSLLKKEQVLTIGVCGRGGMGKTTLVMHIHNLLLKIPNSFHHIYWITVTQDFSIYKLQNLIAKNIDLDLSNEKDEKSRAAKLSKAFLTKQKSVLILDNLRNHFDVEKVGIPIRGNKCKLIFTTRSLDVCKWMGCPEYMVNVEPLSEEEAWSLFAKELGNFDIKVGHLAKFLASECAGFPLGIKTTARSMRGVEDVYAWRKTLQELEGLKRTKGSMELDVFPILEFSYLHLNDLSLQRCLLYCALFPEDCKINKNDLIEYLIAEGIIEARGSRQSQFDKGHFMLDKLENACLLESFITEDYGYVRMHDLIRDMALQIMNSRAMVKAGVQLKEFPDEEKWTEGLMHVSLMRNDIEEVPPNLSPRCTNLATLLLCGNHKLELITDSFVKGFCLLQFLDLSFTAIKELPGSISGLVHLDGLWLRGCYKLRHVPSLAKLRKLKMLNFSNAPLEEVPHGIDSLFKLRYLNLDGTTLKEFSATMFFNLSNLQFLHLHQSLGGLRAVEVEGVAGLRKLESLKCHFYDLVGFNKYLKSQEERQPLCTYDIKIGQLGDNVFTDFMLPPISKKDTNKEVRLYNCNIGDRGDFLALPEGIQKLVIAKCHDARNLCNVQATGLKSFVISECHGVEFLFTLSSFSTDIVKSVETLHLYWLKNLLALFGREGTALQPFPSIGTFSCLRVFDVFNCPSIKKLFPSGLLPNLKHLEVIEVEFCDKMEEIIAAEEEDEGGIMGEERNSSSRSIDASVEFRLPNLRLLKLRNLSELKSICSGVMICDSLQELDVVYCLKLKRLPFSRALLKSIRKIPSYPEEWWEQVEWDKCSAKNIHQPPP